MATWQEFLSSSPQVCGGEICATGTRIPVTVILDSLAEGADKDEVLASYPSRRSAFDTQMGSEATNSLGFNPCRPSATGTLPPPQTLLCLDHRFRASSLKHLAEAEYL